MELTDNNVFPVLYLAKKYLVNDLISTCADHIKQITPNAGNVARLMSDAQRYGELDKYSS